MNAGLYIHIPFCRTKCPYCDFYSIPSLSLVTKWLVAVHKEVFAYKGLFPVFDSIFLGGGTPTVLSQSQWSGLMETLGAVADAAQRRAHAHEQHVVSAIEKGVVVRNREMATILRGSEHHHGKGIVRIQIICPRSERCPLPTTGGATGVSPDERFDERERSLKPLLHPAAAWRVIRAVIRAKRAGRPMMPRDMWDLKALLCSGMDVAAFRDEVKHYWKADPFESYSNTEFGGLLAMQTWNRKGMTFMPDLRPASTASSSPAIVS